MATLIGSVDPRGRPLVRLEGKHESVLVLIDTGFNGELMLTRDAARLVGADSFYDEAEIELADGRTARVFEGRATITWLGNERRVRVFVSDERFTHRSDEPAGLLGAGLLAPNLLTIDFAAGTVTIESRA